MASFTSTVHKRCCVAPTPGLRAAKRQRSCTLLAVAPAREMSVPAQAPPSAESFIRPHLRNLAAYTPIEPFEVLSARLGRRPEEIVKLDANENPYGPPESVRQALGTLQFPHIYPDPETRQLRRALAEHTGVPIENLLVRRLLALARSAANVYGMFGWFCLQSESTPNDVYGLAAVVAHSIGFSADTQLNRCA